jgi:hypothetical protein
MDGLVPSINRGKNPGNGASSVPLLMAGTRRGYDAIPMLQWVFHQSRWYKMSISCGTDNEHVHLDIRCIRTLDQCRELVAFEKPRNCRYSSLLLCRADTLILDNAAAAISVGGSLAVVTDDLTIIAGTLDGDLLWC